MPLFGSKHKHDRDNFDDTGTDRPHPGNQPTSAYANSGGTYQQPGPTGSDYGQAAQGGPASYGGGMYYADNNYDRSTGGGTGTKLTGKVESALGSMVGSQALKTKGLEKEREANAANLQGLELAEAERLEREAMMRRQNAVRQGAHPANAVPGGGQLASTGTPSRPGGGMPGGYPQ